MAAELEQKYLLLKDLYDTTYVLKKAIQSKKYDQIEQMVSEREGIIRQIDQLNSNAIHQEGDDEWHKKIKTLLMKIKEIDEYNLQNMPEVIMTLQSFMNENKKKSNEVNKARMVYEKYQGVPMYKQGNRFDTRK